MTKTTWNDFSADEFYFEEKKAVIVYPKEKPNGKWIIKTEYFNAFPDVEMAFLNKGYHLLYIANDNRWAGDGDLSRKARFIEFASKEFGLYEKCIPIGYSCGGLYAVKLAEKYPHLVAGMYIDAPALNVLSLAGLGDRKENTEQFFIEIANSLGLTRSNIVNYRDSAIDNMEPLIENDIPIYMSYGNADDVVIYYENGKVLYDFYVANGGKIKVECISMRKHHPHGVENPQRVIDFIEENMR